VLGISPSAVNDAALLDDLALLVDEPPDDTRLTDIAPTVKATYPKYLAAGNRVTRLTSVITDDDDIVRLKEDCWSALGRVAFQSIKAGILGAAGGLCCHCGHASAGEIDHYLPKSPFPEFTVFTPNLLPACRRCNGIKSSVYSRANGAPRFLHPVYHPLPDEDYLVAAVDVAATVLVNYSVQQTSGMSPSRFRTLQSHFEALKLGAYFQDEAVRVLSEQLASYYAYFRDGQANGVSKYLRREAQSNRVHYGRAHWKPVLLQALADSAEFCDGGFRVLGAEQVID